MGNHFTKQDGLTTKSIEAIYAAKAADTTHDDQQRAKETDPQPLLPTDPPHDEDETSTNDDNVAAAFDHLNKASFNKVPPGDIVKNSGLSGNNFDNAIMSITAKISSWGLQVRDRFKQIIEAFKKTAAYAAIQAIGKWAAEHPWLAAAFIISIVLMSCTPAILASAGFGAGGIAAGAFGLSLWGAYHANVMVGSLAAGIQAGIGNVAAGSVFAMLTSAGMGSGVGILFAVASMGGLTTVGVGGLYTLWTSLFGDAGVDDEGAESDRALMLE